MTTNSTLFRTSATARSPRQSPRLGSVERRARHEDHHRSAPATAGRAADPLSRRSPAARSASSIRTIRTTPRSPTSTSRQRNANGKVDYVATFHIVKPVDMSQASGLMWHDVPNRGGRITISADLRNQGDVGLAAPGRATTPAPRRCRPTPTSRTDPVPVGATTNGWRCRWSSGVTGTIFGRIINRSGLQCGSR